MNEHDVEIWVERQVDRLDALYMNGTVSTEQYRFKMNEINKRANELLQKKL